jgi:hypothetical protein
MIAKQTNPETVSSKSKSTATFLKQHVAKIPDPTMIAVSEYSRAAPTITASMNRPKTIGRNSLSPDV